MNTLMLDVDNTIINLNQMIVNWWNNQSGIYKMYPINIDCFKHWSISDNICSLGYNKEVINKMITNMLCDKTLYDRPIYMNNYEKIIIALKKFKDFNMKIELNSFCSNEDMILAKLRFISMNRELSGLINSYIFTKNKKGSGISKSFDYDVVIEDNPKYIKDYLEKNISGIVLKQDWEYNNIKDKRVISINEVGK